MTQVRDERFQAVELNNAYVGRLKSLELDSVPRLRITVLFTTHKETIAALRTAGDLAKNLGLQVVLLVVEMVSFHFPLDSPPVSIGFLKQRSLAVISDSGVDAEKVGIGIHLCRDRNQCLQRVLVPNSLIIMGGRKHWWQKREREKERYLRSLGHRVIFVDTKSKSQSTTQSYSPSC